MIFDAILDRDPVAGTAESRPASQLEDIINKALEKDRNLRYQHAADMRADLQRLKRDTETGRAGAASSGAMPVVSNSSQAAVSAIPSSGSTPAVNAASSSGTAQPPATTTTAGSKLWKVLVPAALVLIVTLAAIGFYLRSRPGTGPRKPSDSLRKTLWYSLISTIRPVTPSSMMH